MAGKEQYWQLVKDSSNQPPNLREASYPPELEPNPDLVRMFDYPSFPADREITPDEQDQLKELLGGKGLSLAEMTQRGLAVPYGFTITTQAARFVNENREETPSFLWDEVLKGLSILEARTGKRLGDPDNPLVYSLRSGAKVSMPGMMATILNLGLNNETVKGLAKRIGELPSLDSYQRLIRMYGVAVYGIDHRKFKDAENKIEKGFQRKTAEFYQKLIEAFKGVLLETGNEFEQDPYQQLRQGVEAVFRSAMSPSVIEYRNKQGLPHDLLTAVNVQEVVFGNVNENSGTAVVLTRDNQTGKKTLAGHFLTNAQGEQVVAGLGHPLPIPQLPTNILTQLEPYLPTLEEMVKGVADIEITWDQDGKLWFLQARRAKMTPAAAIITSADLIEEGIITWKEALQGISADQIKKAREPGFEDKTLEEARKNRLLAKGMPVAGVGVGQICLDPDQAKTLIKEGKTVVLICDHFNPNEVWLVKNAAAIVTLLGAPSSHMGLIMSEAGCAGAMGCGGIKINQEKRTVGINGQEYCEGTIVSVNGHTGEIFLEEIPITQPPALPEKAIELIKNWESLYGKDNPWAPFLYSVEQPELRHSARLVQCQEAFEIAQATWSHLPKAQQIAFLEEVLPREIKIPEVIVEAQDINGIKEAILQAKAQGFSVWPRSDNGKLLSPYVGSDLGVRDSSGEVLIDWLNNPNSSYSKWGGLPNWIQKFGVEAVIVGSDPQDKLNPEFKDQHFVCTLRCLASSPPEVVVEIHDQNIHLRSFDQTKETQLIQIVVKASPQARFGLGQINYKFGKDHYDEEKLKALGVQLKQPHVNQEIQILKRKASRLFSPQSLRDLTTDRLKEMLCFLADKNLLTPSDYELFIKSRSLAVANFVAENVFEKWCKDYGLPHLMWAIRKTTKAHVLELQGRLDPEGNSWLSVYGTKGKEEAELLKKLLESSNS